MPTISLTIEEVEALHEHLKSLVNSSEILHDVQMRLLDLLLEDGEVHSRSLPGRGELHLPTPEMTPSPTPSDSAEIVQDVQMLPFDLLPEDGEVDGSSLPVLGELHLSTPETTRSTTPIPSLSGTSEEPAKVPKFKTSKLKASKSKPKSKSKTVSCPRGVAVTQHNWVRIHKRRMAVSFDLNTFITLLSTATLEPESLTPFRDLGEGGADSYGFLDDSLPSVLRRCQMVTSVDKFTNFIYSIHFVQLICRCTR